MDQQFARERYLHAKNVYQPSTRIDNWSEDLCLEEEKLSETLDKARCGNLRTQKIRDFLTAMLRPVDLTQNKDGFLHDGDYIMLKCFLGSQSLYLSSCPALPHQPSSSPDCYTIRNPCPVTATPNPMPRARSVFVVYRVDGRISRTTPIMYGEDVTLATIPALGDLKLHSETKTAAKFAKKSKHQEVELVDESSARTLWKIVFKDKQYRMEMEGTWVTVQEQVVLNHAFTNQNLALEQYSISTIFGTQKEVACHIYLDKFKAETEQNLWQFVTPVVDPVQYNEPMTLPESSSVE